MAKENGTNSNTNDCDLNESDIGDIRKLDGNSLNVNSNSDRHQTGNSDTTKESGNSNGGTPEPPSKREENPFSLKHFLKREQSNTPSTSTNGTNSLSSTNNISSTATSSSASYQNSTGARPKVLQSDIIMMKERDSQLNQQQQHQSTINKMKRSPRFPSFDSQASLNEYKHDDSMTNLFHSRSNTSFPSSTGGTGMLMGCNVNEEYSPGHDSFQRSFSNYDIDNHRHSQLTTSPRTDRRKARFSNNGTGIPCSSSNSGRNSEFPSALPDFVQDHLVVEQLYNAFGNSPPASTSPLTVEGGDQDSDFEDLISRVRPEILPSASCNDIPFDLTFNSTNNGRRSRTRNSPIPLDLPSNLPPDIPLDLPQQLPSKSGGTALNIRARDGRRNPLSSADLTLDLTGAASNSESRNTGYIFPTNDTLDISNCDTSKIQTLPDFLSDGPIHSSGRLADLAQDLPIHLNQSHHHHHHHFDSPDDDSANCGGGNSGSAVSRLRLENERLRQELDDGRRILAEKNRRINDLERVIENERKNEYKYTATLAHSMEQVEENLDKSNKRAAAAQSLANKLKQQVKQLTAEIETLKRENEILRDESSGAVGGSGIRSFNRPSRTQQLSRELMQAASTAENNLKQLLTGVDNLRLMAATIENMDRVSDRNNTQQQQQQQQQVDYLSDCDADDDDDCTGPAL